MTIASIIFSSNYLLALDPQSKQRLSALNNTQIAVTIQDWDISGRLVVTNSQLSWDDSFTQETEAQVDLKATSDELIALLLASDQQPIINHMAITGDRRILWQLQQFLQGFQPNLIYFLSNRTNATTASMIHQPFLIGYNAWKNHAQAVINEAYAYTFYEAKISPGRIIVNAFFDQIIQIQQDFDRVMAKWQRLKELTKQ